MIWILNSFSEDEEKTLIDSFNTNFLPTNALDKSHYDLAKPSVVDYETLHGTFTFHARICKKSRTQSHDCLLHARWPQISKSENHFTYRFFEAIRQPSVVYNWNDTWGWVFQFPSHHYSLSISPTTLTSPTALYNTKQFTYRFLESIRQPPVVDNWHDTWGWIGQIVKCI